MTRMLATILLAGLCVLSALGQGTTGRLSGTVSGPDGVLPGAIVTARDTMTGKEQTVTTNAEGSYNFPQLEFGTYTIRVTAPGFKALVANDQKIDVGREATLSPVLEIGDVSAEVVVTAGADVITATTAQVSNTVSPQQILSLPLLTRNPLSLTGLQAGVSSNSAQNTTINGMRTSFTNITRDGINIQDNFIRQNATDFAPGRPSVDDTGEFTITTSNQEADQGYGGAQIRLVTPRGTHDFHGALFAYNRNSAFAANSFFNNRSGTDKPFRNRNQFGGKASWRLPVLGFGEGVPAVYWDKAFFFFSYEGIKDPITSARTGTILTPTARAGNFTFTRAFAGNPINNANGLSCPSGQAGSTCTVTNILTFARSLGAGFSIFPTGISPYVQSNILSLLPTESNFTGGDRLNTAGFRQLRRADTNRDQYSARIDVDFDDENTLTGIYSYNNETNVRAATDTNPFTVDPAVIQASKNKQFTMAYRRVFTSTFINEFRGGVFTSEVPFDRTEEAPDFFPASGLISIPFNTFLDQGRNTKLFSFQNNADWIRGSHTLRFGGQAQIFRINSYNDVGIVPTYTLATGGAVQSLAQSNFANSCTPSPCPAGQTSLINTTFLGTANNLLALLGGVSNSATQSFNIADPSVGFEPGVRELQPFRFENHALYVSDRWQAMKGLTLNLGVRYEIYPALRLNNGVALEPALANTDDPVPSIVVPNGTYSVIGANSGRRNAYYKTDWDNFAPNLGVAWTPSFGGGIGRWLFGENKTVLRAGYSHIYGNDQLITSIDNAAVGNRGFGRTATTLGGVFGVDGQLATIPPPAFSTATRTYLENNGPGIGNFFGTVFAIDPNIQTPMVKQYSFGVQREIAGDMALEVRYVGSRSDNLGRGVDFNQIDVFNNGFFADFLRAQNNMRASGGANGDPFCAGAGCVPLTIFQNGGNPAAGRLVIGGNNGLLLSSFTNALTNGTPTDLALLFINSTNTTIGGRNNLNNQPCSGVVRHATTNQIIYTCDPNAAPRINFLANPGTGVVDYFFNGASYRYDSLQAEIRKRFSQGLYFQVNYTYSKNLTNAVGTSQTYFEPFLDNGRPELDLQRADTDTTHVFNFNGIYQLPFGQGKRFLNWGGLADKVLGGWEISGLGQWQSGAPITFVDTRGTFNRSARSARQTPFSNLTNDEIQDLVGVFEQNGNIYWIDPAIINANGQASGGYSLTGATFPGQVFFNVAPGQTGNIGRALIDGPSYFNVNMALLKNVRFSETMRLQLRLEAFNVLNNVNFTQNTQFASITSTSFGQITAAFGPRELQWAARFEW